MKYMNENLLNTNNEMIFACRHKYKFLVSSNFMYQ